MQHSYIRKIGLFATLIGGISLNSFSQLYPFSSHTFTNAGQEGRVGPSLIDCQTAYEDTEWELDTNLFNMTNDGIQLWTVPITGRYKIEAYGGQGGNDTYTVNPEDGGLGAKMEGQFLLTEGQVLAILVGQKGGDTQVVTEDNAAAGGGGGTFVWDLDDSLVPFIVAGGGAGGSGHGYEGRNATDLEDGQNSFSLMNGGLAGNGGTTNAGGSSYWGGGGAGWLTNGTAGNQPTNYVYSNPGASGSAEGGRRPLEGGFGGVRYSDGIDEGGDGGFGGGGAGGSDNMGTGGGGGYSGGGGQNGEGYPSSNSGGGGGSFNAGLDQDNSPAFNEGMGYVVITYMCDYITIASSFTHETLGDDGAIDITVTGGVGELTFDWDNDGTGDFDDTEDLTGLAAGTYAVVVKDSLGCQPRSEIILVDQASVQEEDELVFKFYPNPTQGDLYIEFPGEFEYVLFNMNGDKLLNGTAENMELLSLDDLANGVYFIELKSNDKLKLSKVIKQ